MTLWPLSLRVVGIAEEVLIGPVGVTRYLVENGVYKVCVWRNTDRIRGAVIYEMYIRSRARAKRAYRAQVALHGRRLSKEFFSA